jgi:hypothetical protein
VLNISNGELIRGRFDPGDRILEAMGHDGILGLFAAGTKHWAVTEGCLARFDPDRKRWQRVAAAGFRYYWRATAAYDDGKFLYVGSDRGLVGRLDLASGKFTPVAGLAERQVLRITRNKGGLVALTSGPPPLGILPVQLRGSGLFLKAEAAALEGGKWRKAAAADLPPPAAKPKWSFRRYERRNRFDKSRGNFLCGPAGGDAEVKPRYYLKEVFYPKYLCTSPDGKRIWVSTFTGLLRLDVGGAGDGR